MNEHSMWYLSRASGMIAWLVLGITCLWGILLITRMLKPADRPAWLLDLHRYLGVLSIVTTGAHMATLVGDNWEHYGWSELFIPFTKLEYSNSAAIAWGVFAFYLMVIIQLTSWVMKWMPKKLWHAIHLLSYALFVMVTIHGFMAGSDSTNIVFFTMAVGAIAILLFALIARILQGRAKTAQRAAANARLAAD
ncbi:MAG: ferric reductase-like transmembrane domain-containing protein [Ilumatobacteraceae bacterium]